MMKLLSTALLAAAALAAPETPFDRWLRAAETALKVNNIPDARLSLQKALERDAKAPAAWALRARIAAAASDKDEQVYALHEELQLLKSQKAAKPQCDAVLAELRNVDPFADETLQMQQRFLERLLTLAERYEKQGRRHSAIRAHRLVLALDPDRPASEQAIQRIAAAPDPSLADSAKPKDLMADVSEEWVRAHDAQHNTWETRAKLERDNYLTYTDAGYEVLVRAGEAMEQMNAFYRQFFRYGGPDDGKKVSRIELHIFKNRDEYLKLGAGPPATWSGGQFTGGSVETYVGAGGFEEMVGTLFHEAAHQFVSLATNAAGWLNEGLASYFEGTRILANGTVVMNLPANHRLFPLVTRMEKGWMASAADGIDPKDPAKSEPETAPTFRIVLENEYAWGPPWYAPTWGVVYFLYNYQDPLDGRFVYRNAFWDFVNSSGGRVGKSAINNFEKVILGNPAPLTPNVDRKAAKQALKLPKTVDEVDEVWKEWMIALRDEQSGRIAVDHPYLQWAKYALARKDFPTAVEHFEKGVVARPQDYELLLEYARLLAGTLKNPDRASKLAMQAMRAAESATPPNTNFVQQAERALEQWDPAYISADRLGRDFAAATRSLTRRYLDAGMSMVAMDASFRLATALELPSLYEDYEEALKRSGRSLAIWKLAYNEKNLEGWNTPGNDVFRPDGERLVTKLGDFDAKKFDYQFLTLNTVTSGDFSMEAEVLAEAQRVNFCGLVFGRKSSSTFHGVVLFPQRPGADVGYVDLTSFYGSDHNKIWRHNPVKLGVRTDGTTATAWHRLRVDVIGTIVDVWFDGALAASQDFGSLDVLRGSFGLIAGPGRAEFRNIRYLARSARDRTAAIERMLRVGRLPASSPGEGGLWQGHAPPFPVVDHWLQAPLASWAAKEPGPTLFVFWSIEQNELLPVDAWLRDLAQRYGDVGLRIISIAASTNKPKIAEYLAKHPFPGSVGLDAERVGLGATLQALKSDAFGLPRLFLMDLDGRVVWEGDPGFRKGEPWKTGEPTYLDTPLDELVAKRKLKIAAPWRKQWIERGVPALKRGDFAAAAPLLREAKTFVADGDPTVTEAQGKLASLEGALGALESIAVSFAEVRCEPALAVLASWAKAADRPIDGKGQRVLQEAAAGANYKAWQQALDTVRAHKAKIKPGNELEIAQQIVEKLADLPGQFPRDFAQELQSFVGYADTAAAMKWIDEADQMPARWLASRFFRW